MKKTLVLAFLGLVACGMSVANAQEVLINGKFNDLEPGGTQQFGQTPTGWTVVASRGADLAYQDLLASEGFPDVDGGGSGLFFKAFTGNPPWDPTAGDVDGSIYQDNPGTPGMKYILTGFFGAEANYSGLNTPGGQSILALDFLGAGDTLIGSAELDLEAAGLGGPNPGLNYEEFMLMATAPAGTVEVRTRITMLDGVFFQDPGQAFVADCLSLRCVPEPTTALLAGLALVGLVVRRRSA
ncbi:MAG: PEP-CTERM sorting domain-containing protein [Bythopirellula sp.]|nr:PEP-CTERM sorting domain-containing protein [Bythopirellula sp.]